MQADNQNNWNRIGDELQKLDRFPGEGPIDKAQLWGKLNSRLQEKPVPRKMPVYWIAAALLITAGMGWLYIRQPGHRNDLAVEHAKLNTVPANALPHEINDSLLEKKSRTDFLRSENIRPSSVVRNQRQNKPAISDRHSTPANITNIVSLPTIQAPGIIPDTPVVQLIVQSQPVKRLKVVHNNTLNSILYKPELSIGDNGHRLPAPESYFHFGLNQSDNFIQIKIPSNN